MKPDTIYLIILCILWVIFLFVFCYYHEIMRMLNVLEYNLFESVEKKKTWEDITRDTETSVGSYNDLPPKTEILQLHLPPIIYPFDNFDSVQPSDGITVGTDEDSDYDDPYLDEDFVEEETCDFGYEWCPIPHARKQIKKMTSNPLKRFLNKIIPKRKESLDEYYQITALSALEHCSFTCKIREIKGADN